jgi:quinoprotein glucose dehydrogenase
MTADDVNQFILSPEERAAWKDRISSMRNEGLFTPPGLEETLSLPGARGGSNWGTGAANPSKGLVYLTTQDWPTIYKLSLEDPLAARSRGAANVDTGQQQGRTNYEMRCQSCHGINGAGSGGGVPALAGGSRLEADAFRQVVVRGKGEMPAFADLDVAAINAIYAFLDNAGGNRVAPRTDGSSQPAGPVVASGGAPGGLDVPVITARYSPLGGPAYPDGVDAPSSRYYTDWGLYPNQPYVIGPPWSAIVAFDLNNGTIKWRVPLGEDARAVKEGAKDAGVFMAERHGMIVTSTGLLFVATTDGKVRAHDENTGEVLWTAALPAGSEGLPSMYEVNGRQYLVVPASSRINTGGGHRPPGEDPQSLPAGSQSYVAFALPETRK